MRLVRLIPLVLFLAGLFGCSGVRFIIDAVPATDEMTETVVMGEEAGFLEFGKAKVALIDVSGLIMDAQRPGLIAPGENPVARFVESLKRAEGDSAVKAVIIRINSPGGTVTASDLMYREVRDFKERTGKPVVISMGDVAASGGYYLACAGDHVLAHPTTVTGSIGVLVQTINFSEGLRKIGVRADAITSGPNKKMGSPLEPMPPEHRELLQGLVDEFYASFKAVVVERRPALSPNDLNWIMDGRVVSGKRAAEVGLVDRVGDLRDAFDVAQEQANVRSAKLVKYHRALEYVGSPYAKNPAAPAGGAQINFMQVNLDNLVGAQSGFYYLWDPSVN
ncbi:MAG: signal peptide peptidase SppA [Phycisphaerales bacterium]|nr:signal peptide peptidase SppA [Phycisphaerales bacterium]